MRSVALLAALATALATPAVAGPVEVAVSDAIGVFCVPVLLSGRVTSDDIIADSGFVAGAREHPELSGDVGYHLPLGGSEVVEVYLDLPKRTCVVHVHGGEDVVGEYEAALRAQNWQSVMERMTTDDGGQLGGWRVRFGREGLTVGQIVRINPSPSTDPGLPKIAGILFIQE